MCPECLHKAVGIKFTPHPGGEDAYEFSAWPHVRKMTTSKGRNNG